MVTPAVVAVAVSVGVNVKLGVWVKVGSKVEDGRNGSGFPVVRVAVTPMNCGVTADRVAIVRLHALPANIKTAIGNHLTNWKIRMFMIFSLPAENRIGRRAAEKRSRF
jgi:hypothetical protein